MTTKVTRSASILRAILIAAVACALATGVYFVAVQTSPGQLVDQKLFDASRHAPIDGVIPSVLSASVVSNPVLWVLLAAVVLLLAQLRLGSARTSVAWRIGCSATLFVFLPLVILGAQYLRDHILERPVFHSWIEATGNSAPSGHGAAVTALVVVLLRAAPPMLRPAVIAAGGTWAATIEFGVVAAAWHRPSDVIISTVLVAGLGALLPDPHRGTVRRWGSLPDWLAALVVVIATPVIVAANFAELAPIAVSGLIAAVMGIALVVGSPHTARRITDPDIDDNAGIDHWSSPEFREPVTVR